MTTPKPLVSPGLPQWKPQLTRYLRYCGGQAPQRALPHGHARTIADLATLRPGSDCSACRGPRLWPSRSRVRVMQMLPCESALTSVALRWQQARMVSPATGVPGKNKDDVTCANPRLVGPPSLARCFFCCAVAVRSRQPTRPARMLVRPSARARAVLMTGVAASAGVLTARAAASKVFASRRRLATIRAPSANAAKSADSRAAPARARRRASMGTALLPPTRVARTARCACRSSTNRRQAGCSAP